MSKKRAVYLASNIQQIASMPFAMERIGFQTVVYPNPAEVIIEKKEMVDEFAQFLTKNHVDIVYSNVFYYPMMEAVKETGIPFAIFGMDSPMFNTYIPDIYDIPNLFLFYFDKSEYEYVKTLGNHRAYYMPLCTDVNLLATQKITSQDKARFSSDISFVGSFYTKNIYDEHADKLPDGLHKIFGDIMERTALIWDGEDRVEQFISPELVKIIYSVCPDVFKLILDMDPIHYIWKWFFSRKMTQIERMLIFEELGERFDVNVFTWPKEEIPDSVKRRPAVDNYDEAPKVFKLSKINMNLTLRSIKTGIPLRIFDIMGSGGFVLSNYQEEMTELFEEDKEIVLFRTPEELIDKAAYYLEHDDEREAIAANGYKKVKECYTYEKALKKIADIVFAEM